MKSYLAACLQMNSGDRVQDNLRRAGKLIAEAADAGAALAVLPEFFPLLSGDERAKLAAVEADGSGPAQDFLAAAAARHKIYLAGGTVPVAAPDDAGKVLAACPLYAPDGARLARYDKIHLFRFKSGAQSYDESETMHPGDNVTAVDTPLGRIGLSVCYDLRFPEMFRRMGRPDIIVAPSAFVPETGRAHWRLLLRARAVENLAHMLGAAQAGAHPQGRKTHGETMIVGPWGDIKARANTDGDECVMARIDADERDSWRARLPALDNRRL